MIKIKTSLAALAGGILLLGGVAAVSSHNIPPQEPGLLRQERADYFVRFRDNLIGIDRWEEALLKACFYPKYEFIDLKTRRTPVEWGGLPAILATIEPVKVDDVDMKSDGTLKDSPDDINIRCHFSLPE